MNKACDLVDILDLMNLSEIHRRFTVADIHRLVYPPIINDQYKLYHEDDKPVAYASWAYLSEEVRVKYLSRLGTFRADEWRSGTELWFIDFIAPFGYPAKYVRDLYRRFPAGTRALTSRSYGTKITQRIGSYYNG